MTTGAPVGAGETEGAAEGRRVVGSREGDVVVGVGVGIAEGFMVLGAADGLIVGD
jgi:hypothetical protein